MRKELYNMLCKELKEVGGGLIKHIDLWNHNVEFIEQEENWERPAVFVEFCPIRWNAIVDGVEYRAEPEVKLHIVTDWAGAANEGSPFKEEALEVFDLPELIHERLSCMDGDTFMAFDLVESQTNHNTRRSWKISRCIRAWPSNGFDKRPCSDSKASGGQITAGGFLFQQGAKKRRQAASFLNSIMSV